MENVMEKATEYLEIRDKYKDVEINIILKNIELKDGDDRTELDAVVITPYGITIVEVKNTARDIFIDENGNYYRTGEFLNWDCNIVQKMNLKEDLLKRALEKEEF